MESIGAIKIEHKEKNKRILHVTWDGIDDKTRTDLFYRIHIEDAGNVNNVVLPARQTDADYIVDYDGIITISGAVMNMDGVSGEWTTETYRVNVSPDAVEGLRASTLGRVAVIEWEKPPTDADADDVKYQVIVRQRSGRENSIEVIRTNTKECHINVELPRDAIYEVVVTPFRMMRSLSEDGTPMNVEQAVGPERFITVNTAV